MNEMKIYEPIKLKLKVRRSCKPSSSHTLIYLMPPRAGRATRVHTSVSNVRTVFPITLAEQCMFLHRLRSRLAVSDLCLLAQSSIEYIFVHLTFHITPGGRFSKKSLWAGSLGNTTIYHLPTPLPSKSPRSSALSCCRSTRFSCSRSTSGPSVPLLWCWWWLL